MAQHPYDYLVDPTDDEVKAADEHLFRITYSKTSTSILQGLVFEATANGSVTIEVYTKNSDIQKLNQACEAYSQERNRRLDKHSPGTNTENVGVDVITFNLRNSKIKEVYFFIKNYLETH